jgi:hypothetical protein
MTGLAGRDNLGKLPNGPRASGLRLDPARRAAERLKGRAALKSVHEDAIAVVAECESNVRRFPVRSATERGLLDDQPLGPERADLDVDPLARLHPLAGI